MLLGVLACLGLQGAGTCIEPEPKNTQVPTVTLASLVHVGLLRGQGELHTKVSFIPADA